MRMGAIERYAGGPTRHKMNETRLLLLTSADVERVASAVSDSGPSLQHCSVNS